MSEVTKPQLAVDADDGKILLPAACLEKIDGVRLINLTGKATGRSLKPHANLYVTAKYSDPKYIGLDGEATFGDIRGESLCRDTTSVLSRILGEPEIVWNVFDLRIPDTEHLGYVDRHKALRKRVEEIGDPTLRVVPYLVAYSLAAIEDLYEIALNEGFEGLIGRSVNGKVKNGRATTKESTYWRKKPSSDKEAKVVRLVEAQENLNESKTNALGHSERSSHQANKVGKGMVGMLVCIDHVSGIEIDVGAGKMTHEERSHYWNNPNEIVGEFIKYRSLDVGIKDKPRFARYICKRSVEDMSE